jgi:ribosomal protein S18 acetylase RimI-like enzyme
VTFPAPYRARPARRDDLDRLVELFQARDMADVGFLDQSREEILEDWADPSFELGRDSIVAEAPDATIAAYGIVLALDPSVQVFGIGKVHPGHAGRGLGSVLVAETERRAAARLGPGVESPFRTFAAATDHAATDLFLRRGFRHVRSSWHMWRGLPAEELDSSEPEGITLRTGSIDDESIVHEVLDVSFREHFGYEPETFEHWQEWFHSSPGYDPSLIVLALAGDEPVGVSVNESTDDGIGWVGDLGVLPAHRRRGVARALLARSFAELSARGHREVRLGVDTENTTGATYLYENVGMTVRRRFDTYEKRLTGA